MADQRVTGWVLSIDFGTTTTAGAMRGSDGEELVEIDNERRMNSMLCWKEGTDGNTGRLLLGDEAEDEGAFTPQCVERCPKRKLGQEFLLLGSQTIRVTDAIGQIFQRVVGEARRRHGGRDPEQLRLTHPARWGNPRQAKLREAAAYAGFDDPMLVPEPVGAAIYYARKQLSPGDHVAVYDLGGGTFDTAVLRRTDDGFEVAGKPGGRDDFGGEDIDERLYRHLGEQLDPEQWQTLISPDSDMSWHRAHYDFRTDVRRAKERLSRSPDAKIRTPISGVPDLQVTLSEFESLIRVQIESTVTELERTVAAAGQSVDGLSAVYLAGGSSQIQLVSSLIEERLGRRPEMLGDPKSVIALGAVQAGVVRSVGGGIATPEPPAPPPPPQPVPPAPTPPPPETAAAPVVPPDEPPSARRLGPAGVWAISLAALGAVAVIVSLFLHWRTGLLSAWKDLPKHYSIAMTGLPVLAGSLVTMGLLTRRAVMAHAATAVAAFTTATGFSLLYASYFDSRAPLSIGFWLAVFGAVVLLGGAMLARASIVSSDPQPTEWESALRRRTVAAVTVTAASLVLVVAELLPFTSSGHSAWTSDLPTHYPLVITLLAFGAIGLAWSARAKRRIRRAGLTTVVTWFLLGQAFPLVISGYGKVDAGFWLAVAASLVAALAAFALERPETRPR